MIVEDPPPPPPPKKKEAEERHELLKMVLMELTDDQMTKVEQIENKLLRKLQHRQMVLAESM